MENKGIDNQPLAVSQNLNTNQPPYNQQMISQYQPNYTQLQNSSHLRPKQSQKLEKSTQFFKQTRIDSCSYVKQKNGHPVAIPFYEKPFQSSADKMGKSSECRSYSQFYFERNKFIFSECFKVKQNEHIGTNYKTLDAYNPIAFRNRLPIEDPKMPSTNASQIEFGDRTQKANRQFLSASKNMIGNFGKIEFVSNPGIMAEKTKWHHKLQNK